MEPKQYKTAVELLLLRRALTYPGACVLFTSPDERQYEIYGTDAIELSKRLNTDLLAGDEYAHGFCTKIPIGAAHIVQHIMMEAQRNVYIQEPIKIHHSAEFPQDERGFCLN